MKVFLLSLIIISALFYSYCKNENYPVLEKRLLESDNLRFILFVKASDPNVSLETVHEYYCKYTSSCIQESINPENEFLLHFKDSDTFIAVFQLIDKDKFLKDCYQGEDKLNLVPWEYNNMDPLSKYETLRGDNDKINSNGKTISPKQSQKDKPQKELKFYVVDWKTYQA